MDGGGTVGQVQSATRSFLAGYRMRVTGEQDGETHARRGGRLARLVGARLARPRWRPYHAVVRFLAGDGGVDVRVSVAGGSGAAEMGRPLADNYRGHFARWVADLRVRLR